MKYALCSLAVCLLAVLLLSPKIYRATKRNSSPLQVEENQLIGVWSQSSLGSATHWDLKGENIESHAELELKSDGEFILMITPADGIAKVAHRGHWYYSNNPLTFIGVFKFGYRNWISLYSKQFSSPQFYALKQDGQILLQKGNFSDTISSDPFVKK
jgi:hypothetical protein